MVEEENQDKPTAEIKNQIFASSVNVFFILLDNYLDINKTYFKRVKNGESMICNTLPGRFANRFHE